MEIKSNKVERIIQQPGLDGIYDIIETAGRICYESKKSDARDFFNRIVKVKKHKSITEHASIYLIDAPAVIANSKYSHTNGRYTTTNYRVLMDNGMEHLAEQSKETFFHEKRYTFLVHCGRDISAQIIRHRDISRTERSTRYVDMSNLPFVMDEIPTTMMDAILVAEKAYKELLEEGYSKDIARKILPLGLETKIVLTATKSEWDRFIDERGYNSTGKAHPDINEIALMIRDIIYDRDTQA